MVKHFAVEKNIRCRHNWSWGNGLLCCLSSCNDGTQNVNRTDWAWSFGTLNVFKWTNRPIKLNCLLYTDLTPIVQALFRNTISRWDPSSILRKAEYTAQPVRHRILTQSSQPDARWRRRCTWCTIHGKRILIYGKQARFSYFEKKLSNATVRIYMHDTVALIPCT